MRTQFTFYESFFKAISMIKSKAVRCDVYEAVCSYALNGVIPDVESLPETAAIVFELIKPTLDAAERKSRSGKKGGETPRVCESKTEANLSKTEANRSKPEANGSKLEANGSKPEANPSKTKQTESKKEGENKKEKENKIENKKEKEVEIEKERENECYSLSPPSLSEEETVLPFDTFWEHYPKKVGRKDAEKAFKKISEEDRLKILPAIERHKQGRQWRDGYIHNPATWLNGQHWEDEVDEKKEMSPLEEDLADLARWAEGG